MRAAGLAIAALLALSPATAQPPADGATGGLLLESEVRGRARYLLRVRRPVRAEAAMPTTPVVAYPIWRLWCERIDTGVECGGGPALPAPTWR